MTTDAAITAALEAEIELFEAGKWTTGGYARLPDGSSTNVLWPKVGREFGAVAWCAVGAVAHCLGYEYMSTVDYALGSIFVRTLEALARNLEPQAECEGCDHHMERRSAWHYTVDFEDYITHVNDRHGLEPIMAALKRAVEG